ncbi:MAG: complex I NDUFA9 subunit family protein [Alicyclobacillaceae bacterium]|jgi:NADH dehydrogenase|nr:complex I NDUFA9 subunit family protein [Alicyclobacillaceae bacterium]MCY0896434.1 complex I NDUFA9 subunit family protein [Alicyclobacillaceae bacterium]
MKVLVAGGTGYIGVPVVREILARGHQVRVLSRQKLPSELSALGVEWMPGDIVRTSQTDLAKTFETCDAAINLVGIIREHIPSGRTMSAVHHIGSENFVRAAKAHGSLQRYLHMSALGARPHAVSKYHRSKWEGERAVVESGLPFTIFRPSVVFGIGGPGPNFLRQLADLVESVPVVPIIGRGESKLQPVSVQTVAEAFATCLDTADAVGQTYDVAGPEVVSYRDILTRVAKSLSKPLRTLYIPMAAMKTIAARLDRYPWFPITMDQLVMLEEGNTSANWRSLYSDLGLTEIPFRAEF